MKHNALGALVGVILVTPLLFGQAGAPGSGDELQQLTARLQQSPGDQALREKIIALALTLNPKPPTPDAVTMAEGAAEYAFKNAKTNSDYSEAARQYEKALLLAPWLAVDYFNCGVAYEKAGEHKEAIRSFKLYLLAAPSADDAQAVKKRIGGLQYATQKAEDAANEQAKVAAQEAAVYGGLDGGVWRLDQDETIVTRDGTFWRDGDGIGNTYIAVNGHEMSRYSMLLLSAGGVLDGAAVRRPVNYDDPRAKRFDGWKTTFTMRHFVIDRHDDNDTVINVTISGDGQTITLEVDWHYPSSFKMLKTTDIYRRIK